MNRLKGVLTNKLEEMKNLVPGLLIRTDLGLVEIDREFRNHLSEKVEKGIGRMQEIKEEFSNDGKVGLLGPMDKSIVRLLRLGKSLRGDAIGRNPGEELSTKDLDGLYNFNVTLLEEVDKLDLMVEEIATSDGYEGKVREEIKKLDQYLSEIEDLLSRRGDIIKGMLGHS